MAFPVTGILYSGTGANEGPPPTGFSGPYFGNAGQLKRASNKIVGTNASTAYNASYWSVTTFARSLEHYLTVVTLPAAGEEIDLDIVSGTLATPNGYALSYLQQGSGNFRILKYTGGSVSTLATATITLALSDQIGISLDASGNLAIFQNGVSQATANSTSFTGPFNLGIELEGTTTAVTNFGGGHVSVANTSSLTGSLSFTGAASRRTNRALTGAVSFTGAATKRPSRALTGALSFTGSIPSRAITRPLTAALSFTGATAKRAGRALTGGISFTGSATKRTGVPLTGGVSSTGAITRRSNRALPGGLSFTGTSSKATSRNLTGGLSFTGSLPRRVARALTGTLTTSGSTTRTVNRSLQATLSFAGAIVRLFPKAFTAVLSFVGATPKQTSRSLNADLTSSGSLVASIALVLRKWLSGVVAPTSKTGTITPDERTGNVAPTEKDG